MKNTININKILKSLIQQDKKTSLIIPHQKKNKPIKEKKQNKVINNIKKLFLNKRKSWKLKKTETINPAIKKSKHLKTA